MAASARWTSLGIAAALLAGCADRPIEVNCSPYRLEDFAQRVKPVPSTRVGAPAASASAQGADGLEGLFRKAIEEPRAPAVPEHTAPALTPAPGPPGPTYILLSGGGEWGAYGAGFLKGWTDHGAGAVERPDKPQAVTGISTGSLQATLVFLGARDFDDSLLKLYTINNQSQLVHDRGSLFVIGHGSEGDQRALYRYVLAGLAPYIDGVAAEWAPEIIGGKPQPWPNGHPRRVLLVGIVNGATSELWAVDLVKLAAAPFASKRARNDCYVGALIASSAIPILLTQVRQAPAAPGEDPVVYLDGGSQQPVFTPPLLKAWARAAAAAGARDDRAFVLFNTGTKAAPYKGGDLDATVLGAANLTYRAFLQQVEADSAFDVAPSLPGFRIWYTTADNSNCQADPKYRFFDPAFMRCLSRCGQHRWQNTGGGDPGGWLSRDIVGSETAEPECPADPKG